MSNATITLANTEEHLPKKGDMIVMKNKQVFIVVGVDHTPNLCRFRLKLAAWYHKLWWWIKQSFNKIFKHGK
jgi:hypothetical protein